MTDDATLTYMKAGYLEGDNPSRDDAIELIDEIKRLRAENQEIRKWLECSRMLNGELQSELDRYKTPNVDNASFTWSEGAVARAHREALEDEVMG